MDLRREWSVLDELEQRVLENHRAFGGGHVAADIEDALVGLRDVPLLQIVPEVVQTLCEAVAAALERQSLCFGVEREVIAGRDRIHPLLHRKAHPLP